MCKLVYFLQVSLTSFKMLVTLYSVYITSITIDPGTKVGHEQYPIGVDIPDDKGCNVIHLAVLRKGHDEAFETMIKAFLLQMSSIKSVAF